MSKHPFASLHGGLLARKGQASPMLKTPAVPGAASGDRVEPVARPVRSDFVQHSDIVPRTDFKRRDVETPPSARASDNFGEQTAQATVSAMRPVAAEPEPEARKPVAVARPVEFARPDRAVEPEAQKPLSEIPHKKQVSEERPAIRKAEATLSVVERKMPEPVAAAVPQTAVAEANTITEKRKKPARRRYRASVRLDDDQKRRLRIVAALKDWPHQKILSNALDAYLEKLSRDDALGCSCMKAKPAEPPVRLVPDPE